MSNERIKIEAEFMVEVRQIDKVKGSLSVRKDKLEEMGMSPKEYFEWWLDNSTTMPFEETVSEGVYVLDEEMPDDGWDINVIKAEPYDSRKHKPQFHSHPNAR